MRSRPPAMLVVFAAASMLVMVGCGHSGRAATATTGAPTATRPTPTTAHPMTVPPTTRAPVTLPAPTPATTPPTTRATAPPTAPPTTPPSTGPPATSPPTTTAPLLVTRLAGVGDAGQVIAVSASGYGATTATLTAYQRTATGWQQVFGPWLAHVGRNGFAPPGQKREGDGRTPTGAYGFSFMFGIDANPGVHFAYRPVSGPWDVWDDDPSSPNYNEWIDTRSASAGAAPEPMHVAPVYDYGAVIDYNASRTPGLGSAIFFHVSDGGSTAGCVSLPMSELVSVLQWLEPGRDPRMIMGTAAQITG